MIDPPRDVMRQPATEESTEISVGERDALPRLVAVWPGGSVVRDLPEDGELFIGRGEDAEIRIDHTSVSRKHARLQLTKGEVRISDLGSSNGTFVESQRLAPNEPRLVRAGTLIEVGTVLVILRGAEAPLLQSTKAAPGIVVLDPEMQRVHQLVELAARSNLSILLLGETGVGKDIIAGRVHGLSGRASGPFLKVNCAALVESLLEAELFGYEKGAFTGANTTRAGLLESASGGTLFLDEVGEMPMQTQAKLLRALESGEIMRVGSTKARKIDVRFVAATNQDLKKGIQEGRFRQDLYFRLEGVAIRVPPLRNRQSEIAPLVRTFMAEAVRERGGEHVAFTEPAMLRLTQYPWPGNLRELKNLVIRSVLLGGKNTLDVADLHFEPMGLGSGENDAVRLPARPHVEDAEQRRILEALEQCGGNQTRAAKLLGISRGTMVNRLNAMNAPRPRK